MLQGQEGLETEDGMTLELCAGIIDKKEKSAEQHAVEGHDFLYSRSFLNHQIFEYLTCRLQVGVLFVKF